jgi:hypothetical protein
MISHCGMSRAAASANFWSSTAVSAKLPQASTPRCCLLGELVDLREILVGQPGSSDHDVRAVLEGAKDIAFGAVRSGVLDEHVAGVRERLGGRRVNVRGEARFAQDVAQDTARVLARDRSDERHIARLRNRARLAPSPPTPLRLRDTLSTP